VRAASRRCRFDRVDDDRSQVELEYVLALRNKHIIMQNSYNSLANQTSGFDGLLSTSNHLVPDEDTVFIDTSRPIWWVAELRQEGLR
jgi:thiamin pyrophosphokinase-like protein